MSKPFRDTADPAFKKLTELQFLSFSLLALAWKCREVASIRTSMRATDATHITAPTKGSKSRHFIDGLNTEASGSDGA